MSVIRQRDDGRLAPGACGDPECVAREWHYDYDHVVAGDPAERAAADEVARIAWWLRAGLDGPGGINLTEPEAAIIRGLADKLESGERPWEQAPTSRYSR